VDRVSVADPTQPGDARERRDGEAAVHEAVVHDDVREPERRHPRADAEHHRRNPAMEVAAQHDERCGDRSVGRGERVVCLEAPLAAPVVGAMNAPERMVPHAPVEHARPRFHQRGDEQRDRDTERDERERRHEVTS
jgi:hypothetical protein